tara:strand:- start:8015 stop:9439 length:1425 start_codon:yes stop_codon:yes gene_type:complete
MSVKFDSKNIYNFANFLLGLLIVLSLVQIIVQALAGLRFTLFSPYFEPWIILLTIVSLAVMLVLLWYLRIKNYRIAFIAFLISSITSVAYTLLAYLALWNRDLVKLVPWAFVILLCTGIIYSVSLFTSKTRHKRWLFWVGAIGFPLELLLIVLQFWAMNTENEAIPLIIGKVSLWILVLINLNNIFYILNFKEEIDILKNEAKEGPSKLLTGIRVGLGIVSLIAVFLVLPIGFSEYAYEKGKVARSKLMVGDFEAKIYVNAQNDTLRYRLLIPKNYESNKEYPLVVNLHNGGGVGTDNWIQLDATTTAQLLSTAENREKYPAFIFLPQSPTNSGFGGITDDPGVSGLVFEAMDQLEKEYSIDVKRRYVVGMSTGGYGTWYFIGHKPEKFAAAIPICGGGDPSLAAKMTHIPIWAFHGKADKAVPVQLTQNMIKAIREAGGSPKYTEFAAGHLIWGEIKSTPGYLDWLFAQKRTD